MERHGIGNGSMENGKNNKFFTNQVPYEFHRTLEVLVVWPVYNYKYNEFSVLLDM
jgi:hypothetical protein